MIAKKLKTVGLLQSFIHEVTGQELTNENLTETCAKYRFSRHNSDTVDYNSIGKAILEIVLDFLPEKIHLFLVKAKNKEDSSSSSSEDEDKVEKKTSKTDKHSLPNKLTVKHFRFKSIQLTFQTKEEKDVAGFIKSLFGRKKRETGEMLSLESIEEELRAKRAALPTDPDFIGKCFEIAELYKKVQDEFNSIFRHSLLSLMYRERYGR